jgi:hypothetical protein
MVVDNLKSSNEIISSSIGWKRLERVFRMAKLLSWRQSIHLRKQVKIKAKAVLFLT